MDDVLICASSGTGPCYVDSYGHIHYILNLSEAETPSPSGTHCSIVGAAVSLIAGRTATCHVGVVASICALTFR
jgi:hypothetical protein